MPEGKRPFAQAGKSGILKGKGGKEEMTVDELWFFEGKGRQLELYQQLRRKMEEAFPHMGVKVQKTQITFVERHVFGCVSLRKLKGYPPASLVVSFGLGRRVEHPRIAAAAEPYPNRWTHHVVVAGEEEIDGELMGWLEEAHTFALVK